MYVNYFACVIHKLPYNGVVHRPVQNCGSSVLELFMSLMLGRDYLKIVHVTVLELFMSLMLGRDYLKIVHVTFLVPRLRTKFCDFCNIFGPLA